MKSYLVTLASDHDSGEVVSRALTDCLADGARLVAIFIARLQVNIGVSRKLMESSFLGQAQTREMATEIKKSTLQLGQQRLQQIESEAESFGVECETNLVNGSFHEQTLVAAREGDIARIYISSDNRNVISRLFLRSEVDTVADGANCDVIVVDGAFESGAAGSDG